MSTPGIREPGTPKTGSFMKGVKVVAKNIREVESVMCSSPPLHDETHKLVNNAKGETACVYCGRSWAELDAELNGATR